MKVNGKIVRRSLETTVFTTAKLRLANFLKEQETARTEGSRVLDTFKDARLRYEQQLEARHDIKATTKRYRRICLNALAKTWPELDGLKLERVTFDDCQAWAGRFSAKYDEVFFNGTLGTLRTIFDIGGLEANRNPACRVKRLGVPVPELKLPEPTNSRASSKVSKAQVPPSPEIAPISSAS